MDKRLLIPLLAGLLLCLVVVAGQLYLSPARGEILPGIKVGGVEIGGLGKEQAKDELLLLQKAMLDTPVTLTYQEQSWPLPLKQVGLEIDMPQTLQLASSIGKKGSFFKRWQLRRKIARQSYVLQPVFKVNNDLLAEVINNLAGHLNVPPKDAVLSIDDQDGVVITPSQKGQRIDIELLVQNLQKELLVSNNISLPLPVTEVNPEHSTEDIQAMGITGLLSSYTTKFNPKLLNRSYNIRVAANALDGLIVAPGEEVSFNEVVGPRSSEAGYKSAGVIINNEMVEGLGGGVCQVSTTLYNAVLLAGVELVERYNHSLPVSYVPVGRDATVVYGALDFKFQNNTGRCLYLKTEIKSGQLTVKIFGKTTQQKVTVNSWVEKVLEPQVVYEEDHNLKRGQQVVKKEGKRGFVVKAERIFTVDEQLIKRENLPTSRYNAENKIIAVGTAEPEPVVTPPEGIKILPVTEYNHEACEQDAACEINAEKEE